MLNKLLIVNVWFQDSIVDILHIQNSIILIQTTEYNSFEREPDSAYTPNILLISYETI